ncbi:MAG: Type 1 glutamine amidotransferase-like domain-containing protein [Planctomycetota bacterium]
MLSSAILLGPQRHVPIVRAAVETLVPEARSGPLAVVTAGWEERESEEQELREHVQRPLHNLAIWERVERIFERDPELLEAMRQRHDRLRSVQERYRLRLQGLIGATAELLRREGDPAVLDPERQESMSMLRQLDDQHVARIAEIHREFEVLWRPHDRTSVVREKLEISRRLRDASCLMIAGGHVSVLLHRLRLFDVFGLWGDRPVIAWSAGAMVLTQRIVLFHDSPSQGNSDTEVMEAGFGLVPDVVALPHAKQRLQTEDALRVQMFARRFAPASCALLDRGSRLDWRGGRWQALPGTRRLVEDGSVVEARP